MKKIEWIFIVSLLVFVSVLSQSELNKLLLEAVSKNDIPKADYLLSVGTNIDIRNDSGYTPLMIAAESGNTDMVKFILAKYDEKKTQAKDRESALQLAMKKYHIEIMFLLGGLPQTASPGPTRS